MEAAGISGRSPGRYHTRWWSMSAWWTSLPTIVMLYLCLNYCCGFCNCWPDTHTQETVKTLASRMDTDWSDNWLSEHISVCDLDVLSQLSSLACDNDPRKFVRKRSAATGKNRGGREAFLPLRSAMSFLRSRRRSGRRRSSSTSKDEECCFENGCKWEELGEYCNMHSRQFHSPNTQP